MNPKISIIIPCYNHGEYLMSAINSVENFSDKSVYEIIIINDGSNDAYTIELLSSLEKRNYNVINQENLGLATARNNAIKVSKGEYFLPLDADNKIRKAYISKSINILDNNENIGVVYGDSQHFGDESRLFKPRKFSLKKLLIENYIDACAVIRKKAWEQTDGYDSKASALSDWELNLSIAELGWEFYYIPEIMFDYRVLNISMLRSHPDLQKCINYIAKKHGTLYRNEFLKTITISDRIKSSVIDLYKKLTGNPNY